MLRLQPLEVLYPTTWDEASSLLSSHPQARLLAGGTDLLPALKQYQESATVLVSLARMADRGGIEVSDGHVQISARTPLAEIVESPLLPAALARAAGLVAGPQIRHRATLGGNLCLEPRCRYVNQSLFYRQALGGCLKVPLGAGGTVCHVVPGGTQCVAAQSSDTVPVLIALGAWLDLLGPAGHRILRLADFYNSNGCSHLNLLPGEVLRSVQFTLPPPTSRLVYRKWRPRESIDFPLVSLALRLDVDGPVLSGGALVVGALGPRPRVLSLTHLVGRGVDPALADGIVALAGSCRPLANIPYDAAYRRQRLLVEVRRAALEAL